MTSRSHPEVIDLSYLNLTTCIVEPKKPGLCLLEFKTFNGFEIYLVRVSPTHNVTIKSVDHDNRIWTIMNDGKTVSEFIDDLPTFSIKEEN